MCARGLAGASFGRPSFNGSTVQMASPLSQHLLPAYELDVEWNVFCVNLDHREAVRFDQVRLPA